MSNVSGTFADCFNSIFWLLPNVGTVICLSLFAGSVLLLNREPSAGLVYFFAGY